MSTRTNRKRNPSRVGNCPQCSTVNDLFYTYCRRCLEELPDQSFESTLSDD